MSGNPYAQWFEPQGRPPCPCGRRATGILRDHRNGIIGPRCQRCARAEIDDAHRRYRAFQPDAAIDEGTR